MLNSIMHPNAGTEGTTHKPRASHSSTKSFRFGKHAISFSLSIHDEPLKPNKELHNKAKCRACAMDYAYPIKRDLYTFREARRVPSRFSRFVEFCVGTCKEWKEIWKETYKECKEIWKETRATGGLPLAYRRAGFEAGQRLRTTSVRSSLVEEATWPQRPFKGRWTKYDHRTFTPSLPTIWEEDEDPISPSRSVTPPFTPLPTNPEEDDGPLSPKRPLMRRFTRLPTIEEENEGPCRPSRFVEHLEEEDCQEQ